MKKIIKKKTSVKKKPIVKSGRPKKHIFTEKDYGKIEAYFSLGLSIEDVALLFDYSEKQFRRIKDDDSRIMSAYKKGEKGFKELALSKLRENIIAGKEASIFFYLKTRHNFRETDKDNNNVLITPEYIQVKNYIANQTKEDI